MGSVNNKELWLLRGLLSVPAAADCHDMSERHILAIVLSLKEKRLNQALDCIASG
jgi:hypothetical protein